MGTKLFWLKLSTARVFVVVRMNFRVTFETDGNGVVDIVASTVGDRYDMIRLHFHAAKAMADATASMNTDQKVVHIVTVERHVIDILPLSVSLI
jgi:hypothetical protein